ncbi:hypothetical protein [Kineococcus rhizosphaerae]|uniref:Toxin-antitoxin system n=1 Tax=Kineococcus rhizosphaerae TaxID=559628 RepID=A0A2T0QWP9_9ACTN|nr:hypothetical protein [Kineococcus rhizosphaerae]PRY09894.1 hypothetical protein CLV37_1192 [Kineococcus rhizosphaerae]
MAERRKPGPKPRGVREPITARVPADHRKLYVEQAKAMGIPLTDYVALVMARAHHLADPAFIKLPSGDAPVQEELRMSA